MLSLENDMCWESKLFEMVKLVASSSKDRSTKVGAVIVGPSREIRSTGYNDFPRGVDDEVDDRSGFEELSSVLSKVKNFMKTWGVGYEIKSLKTEPGATSEVRKIIAQNIEKGDVSTNGLEKDIKSKVQNYKDGKPNIPTWKINRIARSEANDIRQISKLIDYKKQGFKFVKHVATLDGKTGQDSKIFNGSIFEIDWLFENPNFRINLRPNDRCNYVPSRGPQKINPQARVWVRKNKK